MKASKKIILSLATLVLTVVIALLIARREKWPIKEFHEARAYRLNWEDAQSMDPFIDPATGGLNSTCIPENGVLLSPIQVSQLRKAIGQNHKEHDWALCHYPHHAIHFTNASGETVGLVQICFQCLTYYGYPSGFAENWDVEGVRSLMKELGIPISNPAWREPAP